MPPTRILLLLFLLALEFSAPMSGQVVNPICVVSNAQTTSQVLTATNNGKGCSWQTDVGGGVTSITAGTGISVNAATGAVTVTNSAPGASPAGSARDVQVNAGGGLFGTGGTTLATNGDLVNTSVHGPSFISTVGNTAGGNSMMTKCTDPACISGLTMQRADGTDGGTIGFGNAATGGYSGNFGMWSDVTPMLFQVTSPRITIAKTTGNGGAGTLSLFGAANSTTPGVRVNDDGSVDLQNGVLVSGNMGLNALTSNGSNMSILAESGRSLAIGSNNTTALSFAAGTTAATFAGILAVNGASVTLSNSAASVISEISNTGGSGRRWQLNAFSDGKLYVTDKTGSADILTISTTGLAVNGTVVVSGASITVGGHVCTAATGTFTCT